MARKQVKKGKKKVKGPFKYTQKGPDPYHSLLNFIQTQAHNNQVSALLQQVSQAQAFAKRARQDALDEAYGSVGPMEIDKPARPQPEPRPSAMEGITRGPFDSRRERSNPSQATPRSSARTRATGTNTPATPPRPAVRHWRSQTTGIETANGQTQAGNPTADGGSQTDVMFGPSTTLASHLAHTTEPVITEEILRDMAGGVPTSYVDRSHRGGVAHPRELTPNGQFYERMIAHARYSGAEHGGIPQPDELRAFKQATLEMRSRDDAAHTNFPRFMRGEYRPVGRDFKAPRMDVEANARAGTFADYLKNRLSREPPTMA